MSAQNTDKFRKACANFVTAVGAGGVSDGVVTTVPLVSVTNLPTDTGIDIVIDRVDSNGNSTPTKMETITGVISSTNLINCLRGVEGTAQAHAAGAVVEVMLTAAQWNSFASAMLQEHAQSGLHKGPVVATYSPSSGATATLDLSTGNRHQITMPAGNITVALTNGITGQIFIVEVNEDSVGSRSVTWFSTIRWEDGNTPVLSGANKRDVFGFVITGTNTYDGYIIGQNI